MPLRYLKDPHYTQEEQYRYSFECSLSLYVMEPHLITAFQDKMVALVWQKTQAGLMS